MARTAHSAPDAAAYGRLIEPLLESAAGYARCILRNREDAADAVQQAALRGLERIGTYDASQPFKGWWFAILRHCCIDSLRRAGMASSMTLNGQDPPAPWPDGSDRWEGLAVAIERLSREHQEILRLRYFGGLSYRELAESLGIPPGTIMSRLHLARRALARQVRQEDL